MFYYYNQAVILLMNRFIYVILFLFSVISSCTKISDGEELYRRIRTEDGRYILLYENNQWEYEKEILSLHLPEGMINSSVYSDSVIDKSQLRPGIAVTEADIEKAIEMKSQGWKYIMPRPKSDGADWTVKDGRTTWYNGYWENEITKTISTTIPRKFPDGFYKGDNILPETWRRGGRPRLPTELEWLLSETGGVIPK
jgi:hypothetical protein